MLSNAYFLAKFRFDTAENEPAKKLQNFANFANPNPNPTVAEGSERSESSNYSAMVAALAKAWGLASQVWTWLTMKALLGDDRV